MRRRRRPHEAGQSEFRDYTEPGGEEKTYDHHGGSQQEPMFHLPAWHDTQHQSNFTQWNQTETMDIGFGEEKGEGWMESNFTSGQHAPDISHSPAIGRAFVLPSGTSNPTLGGHQMQIDAHTQQGYGQGSIPTPQAPQHMIYSNEPPIVPHVYRGGTQQHQPEVFHGDWVYGTPSDPFLGQGHPSSIQNPMRYQNQRAPGGLEIAESFESHSTQGASFPPPPAVNQAILNSRRINASSNAEIDPNNTQEQILLCAPVSDTTEDINEDNSPKSPLPQNLRGDPFRSAKVKTELCRHFGTEAGCPFGDKCNYAHGEEELKYKKLMDLEREGQADVEIFRTHVCPTWVSTGACPFDQRCTGLHDPRIIGSEPSWLPHAETLVNSIGASVNVDKLYHQQLAAVYSCSPIHGYIPTKKWKADEMSTNAAWAHFYAFVCNMDVNSILSKRILSAIFDCRYRQRMEAPSALPAGKKVQGESVVSELDQILIALKMRKEKRGQCYAYLPTHLFCGELCMVLQTRFFRIHRKGRGACVIEDLPDQGDESSDDAIAAYEIVFGAVSDPSTRQHSIWFNIPRECLVECTPQQAKRHKRSRHRLKKNRPEKLKPAANSPQKVGQTPDERTIDSLSASSLNVYQPIDNTAFDLITNIMSHYARVLESLLRNHGTSFPRDELHLFKNEQKRLRASFEGQRQHWMTWSWPVNLDNFEVNDDTDIPPINMLYRFGFDSDDYFQSEHFHGINDRKLPDVISYRSRLTVGFLWKSFLINMHLIRGEIPIKSAQSVQASMPSHDMQFYKLRRLPVLRSLSLGIGTNAFNRHLTTPRATRSVAPEERTTELENEPGMSTIETLLNSWEVVKTHYKKNQNNPSQDSKTKKQKPSSTISQNNVGEQRLETWLEQKAQMWSRAYLDFSTTAHEKYRP